MTALPQTVFEYRLNEDVGRFLQLLGPAANGGLSLMAIKPEHVDRRALQASFAICDPAGIGGD